MVHLFILAFYCELSPEPFHEVLRAVVVVGLLEGKPHKDAAMGEKYSINSSFCKAPKGRKGRGRGCTKRDT